jgi:5-methyltetrahydropteroyltriglutamate--homocysteine methyltransferase
MIAPRRVARDVYADIGELWADLGRAYRDAIAAFAAAGCRYLQIDDVNSASLTDPNRRAFWQSLGHDPEDLLRAFVEINNAGLEARPPSMTVGVHMCRGNYQSQWAGEGGYDFVAERYFSSLDVDGFLLEYDDERSGGFDPLRFVPEDKFVILGILTSKQPELEPREALRRKIDEASKYVPTERLGIGPQCGFASTHHGNLLTEKDQRCKLAYAVEIATEVWGGV